MCAFAEYIHNGFHFRNVAYGSRCAVHVDVVDVFGLHACVFESIFHSELCSEAVGVSCGEVVSVGRETAAGYFTVDFGAACESVLEFFEYENS